MLSQPSAEPRESSSGAKRAGTHRENPLRWVSSPGEQDDEPYNNLQIFHVTKQKRPWCTKCDRPQRTCLCSAMVSLTSRYQVVILQDPIESRHALSTSPLLAKSLQSAQLHIGERFDPASVIGTNWRHQTTLVYPGENSVSAAQIRQQPQRDVLIFLDGTWRKTARLLQLNAWLNNLPRVAIDAQRSHYRIRRSPKPEGLATIEAAVQCLNTLEPDKDFSPILGAFHKMIDYQIAAMGKETFERNHGTKLDE